MSILLAGPWIGELGWELFCWQGVLRRMSRDYDATYVLCRAGHEFLYRDFAQTNEVPAAVSDRWKAQGVTVLPANQPLVRYRRDWEGVDWLASSGQTILRPAVRPASSVDVVIHARARSLRRSDNWPVEQWGELASRFLAGGLTVAVVGQQGGCHRIEIGGVRDDIGLSLEATYAVIRAARVMVGTSSGPMHLASLAGVPHVVLTDESNRRRYAEHWNPFRTRYEIPAGGWQAEVTSVADAVSRLLAPSAARRRGRSPCDPA